MSEMWAEVPVCEAFLRDAIDAEESVRELALRSLRRMAAEEGYTVDEASLVEVERRDLDDLPGTVLVKFSATAQAPWT